jgi:hypothetical protein
VLFPTTISSAWPVSKKVFGTYTPFWDGFSLSDSSKNQNGRRKSFAERLARGAKINMADFFNEIGHFCFKLFIEWNFCRNFFCKLRSYTFESALDFAPYRFFSHRCPVSVNKCVNPSYPRAVCGTARAGGATAASRFLDAEADHQPCLVANLRSFLFRSQCA